MRGLPAGILGAIVALAIVAIVNAALDRFEPVAAVLVDEPDRAMIVKSDWTQCVTIAPSRPLLQPPSPPMNREPGSAHEGGNA
jgi:hypothetical protein